MGTKVEYSINLLEATSVLDRNNLTVASGVDVWEHYQTNNCQRSCGSGTNKLQDPIMDRLLDQKDIESIKKTMQMHEDIFKQQVRELHRVYSVQKLLMDNLRKETRIKKFQNSSLNSIDANHPQIFIGQQHKTTQISFGSDNFHVQSMRELELGTRKMSTESFSGDTVNIQRGLFDLERPAVQGDISTRAHGSDEREAAGPSSYTATTTTTTFQSCKEASIIGGYDEEIEVDLTLSVGGGSKVKKSHVMPPISPIACIDSPNGKTRELNSDRVRESSDTSSVALTQEIREGPNNWLSQGLRLK